MSSVSCMTMMIPSSSPIVRRQNPCYLPLTLAKVGSEEEIAAAKNARIPIQQLPWTPNPFHPFLFPTATIFKICTRTRWTALKCRIGRRRPYLLVQTTTVLVTSSPTGNCHGGYALRVNLLNSYNWEPGSRTSDRDWSHGNYLEQHLVRIFYNDLVNEFLVDLIWVIFNFTLIFYFHFWDRLFQTKKFQCRCEEYMSKISIPKLLLYIHSRPQKPPHKKF